MNPYKKFTNYLLTHQPLLWHSMGIQLTVTMILLNVLFYFMAYSSVDMTLLRESYDISRHFYREAFSLFWVISGLTILVIWGAYFYRHNAAKNFYPISRWYFHKMALLLFIPLLFFFWTPFSFHQGVSNKTKNLISQQNIVELTNSYFESIPFLLSANSDYSYGQRNFPEVYLDIQYYNQKEDDSYYVQYFYNGKQQKLSNILKQVKAKPIVNQIYVYRTRIEESHFFVNGDSCLTYIEVFEQALDSNDLLDFELASVKNFNYDNFLNYMMPRYQSMNYHDEVTFTESSEVLKNKMAERIQTSSRDILAELKNFKKLLDEFGISNTLDPAKNFNYLIKNNFRYHRDVTLIFYDDEYSYEYDYAEPFVDDDTLGLEGPAHFQDADHFTQSLSHYSLENLLNNANIAHSSRFFRSSDEFYFLLYFALALTLLLLYFEWGNILSFVIGIPVGGALFIIGVLINLLVTKMFYSGNDYGFNKFLNILGPLTYIVLAGSVLLIAYRGIKSSWNVYVTNVAICLSYFVFPIWIAIAMVFLNIATTQVQFDACLGWNEHINLFDLNNFWIQKIMKWSPFVLFFISLFAIKKILAKKE